MIGNSASRSICHPAWALATPAETPVPPSGRVSAGLGGAQGVPPRGSDGVVQAPPTSEAEATIQRLIAQADALTKTVTELAFQAWNGTQRCGDCRFVWRTPCGRCLQVIDALTAAGFGDQMRDWAGA